MNIRVLINAMIDDLVIFYSITDDEYIIVEDTDKVYLLMLI